MASGIGERPLPGIAEEKALLGLPSDFSVTQNVVSGNQTRYLVFTAGQVKQGLLITNAGASLEGKRGLYIFGSTTNGAITLTPILTPAQGTYSAGQNFIKIVNNANGVYLDVIMFLGDAPVLSSTQPT